MNCHVQEGLKNSDNYSLGRGGSARVNYNFFYVPNVLKIISRHLSFFKYRGRGVPWGPGGHLEPPFAPWQTLSVLQPTLCVVWTTFCMVQSSFCVV